ncbi:PREDICTED: wound-induced proteinase inhibitor 2-like [Ipomoea nil]|uniref:wound-induced proteinase inhibitor 2-like n=1 Tax=Ipomoea nil TaxID=35883 RepID=UPI00090144B8|nr:PREDICTED: wound-induced proteinase inhibitor 2-like [Ipomoea nil]
MAASGTKLGSVTLLLLLLCGIVAEVKQANAQSKPCPRNCDGRAEVMLCPRQDRMVKKVGKLCTNCCLAESMGCILLDQNGTPYCEEEPSSFRKIVTVV